MRAALILAAVLLALWLLGQLRIGVRGEYREGRAAAWARLGPLRLRIYPLREKKQEKRPGRKKSPEPPPQGGKGPGPGQWEGALDYLRALLPLAREVAGQFRRKLRVDTLVLELQVGADDPGEAALRYGQANALVGAAWGALEESFQIRDGRASVRADLTGGGTRLRGEVALSLKLGQALWLGIHFGWKGLRQVLHVKKRREQIQKQGKAV